MDLNKECKLYDTLNPKINSLNLSECISALLDKELSLAIKFENFY